METIAAIATARGAAGVGIIRISGDTALQVLEQAFVSPQGEPIAFQPRYLHYGIVQTAAGERLDDGLAVYMPAPHSFTGEDVAEIQGHGGNVVLQEVLHRVLSCGARLAFAGEFTQRAFLNGRLDLSQAEAISDVISAKSAAALLLSQKQLGGSVARRISYLCDRLLDMQAAIEVAVDYPEEEEYAFFEAGQQEILQCMISDLQELKRQAGGARLYRDGLRIALIGSTNAGKSTLLNTLLEQNRAIVTEIAGTTRDTIEAEAALFGMPLLFVDTAGIRETADIVEQIGVNKSKAEIEKADAIFLLIDGAENAADAVNQAYNIYRENLPAAQAMVFVLVNKQDCAGGDEHLQLAKQLFAPLPQKVEIMAISAATGGGLDELKESLYRQIQERGYSEQSMQTFINARQAAALEQGLKHLEQAFATLQAGMGLDLMSVDLESARLALGEITGSTAAEDVIDRIFEKFCLGK